MEKNINQQQGVESNFKQDLEILRQTYLFANLGSDCLKLFAMLCKRIILVDGETMINQGESLDHAFYLINGSLQVTHLSESGEEHVLPAFQSGDFGGGASLLARLTCNFKLQARGDSQLMYISKTAFEKIESQFPEIRGKMAANLVLELARRDLEFLFKAGKTAQDESLMQPVSLV
ncbi:MAG: cyclic nucleotide-binding domain-containing protein [Desulfocapsaceae bacterium]|nr:cyclic nucleotide-binding domain-containing protein [Desulfocapsaceae bacterium]